MRDFIIIASICAALGVCGGFVAEKTGVFPGNPPGEETSSSGPEKEGERMRFSLANKGKAETPPSGESSDGENWEKLQKQYGSMSHEQLRKEFERLSAGMKWEGVYAHDKNSWKINVLCSKWGELAPRQALAELKAKGGYYCTNYENSVFQGWASRNPEEFSQYYKENREKLCDGYSMEPLMASWARTSPDEAWKWMKDLNMQEKSKGMGSFFSALLEKNSGKIQGFLRELPEECLKRDSWQMNEFVKQWAAKDRGAMEEWMNSLSEKAQDSLKPALVSSLLEKDPDEAGKQFSALSPKVQESAFWSMQWELASRLGTREACEWLLKNTSEEGVENVSLHMDLSQGYGVEDYGSVRQWMETLPEGKMRDKIAVAYVSQANTLDYGGVISLAGTIGNAEQREAAISTALSSWTLEDSPGARRWVENSSYSVQEKEKWLKGISEMEKKRKTVLK